MGRALGHRLASEGLHVILHDDVFEQGKHDIDWLTYVGSHGWIALTKDRRIRGRPLEKQALIRGKVRAFVFTGGNLTGAEMADAIVKAIPDILKLLRSRKGPFIARITSSSNVAVILPP